MSWKSLSRATKQTIKIPNKFFLSLLLVGGFGVASLALAPQAYAIDTPRYVNSTIGSDATDCATPATPCLTINYAIGQAISGDTINVAAGTYIEQVVIDKNVMLAGAGSGTTTIQAPGVLTNDPDGAKDIVLFTGAITAEISGFTIQGPVNGLNFGIYIRAGATANIHDNVIKDIRDAPLSGAQIGVAIEVGKYNDTAPFVNQIGTATITHNTITGYQKTGIAVERAGSSATITGNTITGAGPMTTTAQNGIQIRRGATGTIQTNTVTDNAYDGPIYSAEGIGVLHAGSGVIVQGNIVNHNGANIYSWKSDGLQILDNQVSDSSPVDQNASAGITVQSDGSPSCCGGSPGSYIIGLTISGNTVRNNLSGASTQSDGINLYAVNGATVSNNVISGSSYDGILIGASGNITITGNRFSGNGLLVADTQAAAIDLGGLQGFPPNVGNGDANTLGGFTVHNNSFTGNRNAVWNYDTGAVDAASNYWGTAVLSTIQDKVSGAVTVSPYFVDPLLTTLNTVAPSIVYVNPAYVDGSAGGHIFGYDAFTTIQAGEDAVAPGGTVSVVAQVTGGQTTLTGSTSSGNVTVTIPAGTTVTANGTWDGVINPPTVTTIVIPDTPGFTNTIGLVFSVGSDSVTLTFDKGVRLVLPGQAGKHVGFIVPGGIFTEITSVCSDDTQDVGNALTPISGACKIDVGGNLVIWTKHFTKFVSYTKTSNPVQAPTSSGGGSSSSSPVAATPQPNKQTYTVVSGNTLFGIGTTFGVDWHLIASLNGINTPYTIYPGQVLRLPSGSVATLASGTAAQGTGAGTGAGVLGESSNAQIATPLSTTVKELPAAAVAAPAVAQKAGGLKWYWYVAIAAVVLAAGAGYYVYQAADKNKTDKES